MPRPKAEPIFDAGNPEWTNEDFARARPATELPDEILAQFPVTQRRLRGPQKAPTKVPVHIRLSPDVLEAFKAEGKGWQAKIDETLRRAKGL